MINFTVSPTWAAWANFQVVPRHTSSHVAPYDQLASLCQCRLRSHLGPLRRSSGPQIVNHKSLVSIFSSNLTQAQQKHKDNHLQKVRVNDLVSYI